MLSCKYEPKKFEDIIGLDLPKKIVISAIKNKPFPLFIFAGSSGTGKTSLARLFVRSLQCGTRGDEINPCGICRSCTAQPVEVWGTELTQNLNMSEYIIVNNAENLQQTVVEDICQKIDQKSNIIYILIVNRLQDIHFALLNRAVSLNFEYSTQTILEEYTKKILAAENVVENIELIKQLVYLSKGNIRQLLINIEQLIQLGVSEENCSSLIDNRTEYKYFELLGKVHSCSQLELFQYMENTFSSEIPQNIFEGMLKTAFKILQFSLNRIEFIDKNELIYCEALSKMYGESLHSLCDYIMHLTNFENCYRFYIDMISLRYLLNGRNPYFPDKNVRIVQAVGKREFTSDIQKLRYLGRKQNQEKRQPDLDEDNFGEIISQLSK